jgi:hypothetical protein
MDNIRQHSSSVQANGSHGSEYREMHYGRRFGVFKWFTGYFPVRPALPNSFLDHSGLEFDEDLRKKHGVIQHYISVDRFTIGIRG